MFPVTVTTSSSSFIRATPTPQLKLTIFCDQRRLSLSFCCVLDSCYSLTLRPQYYPVQLLAGMISLVRTSLPAVIVLDSAALTPKAANLPHTRPLHGVGRYFEKSRSIAEVLSVVITEKNPSTSCRHFRIIRLCHLLHQSPIPDGIKRITEIKREDYNVWISGQWKENV